MAPELSRRRDPRQDEADALGLSIEELIEMEQNRKDQSDADYLGVEPWEIRMRRSGASAAEIDSRREKLRQAIRESIDE